MASRSRTLAWSKEVERRARDLYQRVWPETERTKRHGVEDYEGCTDLVGLPHHVQVKGRSADAHSRMWQEADRASKSEGSTHLVVQTKRGPALVTMSLKDYVDEIEDYVEEIDRLRELVEDYARR